MHNPNTLLSFPYLPRDLAKLRYLDLECVPLRRVRYAVQINPAFVTKRVEDVVRQLSLLSAVLVAKYLFS